MWVFKREREGRDIKVQKSYTELVGSIVCHSEYQAAAAVAAALVLDKGQTLSKFNKKRKKFLFWFFGIILKFQD